MPLFFGDKPEVALTGQLRREGARFKPLFHALRRLKAQFGKDAEGISLVVNPDPVAGNVGGFFDPSKNQVTLNAAYLQELVKRGPLFKTRVKGVSQRSFISLAQAVLRHEFTHGVRMNRERRTGEVDTPVAPSDSPGSRVHGGAVEGGHGLLFNRLNVSIQGVGSEVETPHIGLPPELRALLRSRF